MPDAPLLDLVVRLRNHVADPADGLADADLLQRYVRERDAVSFEALVWRHARLVMGVCRRSLRHRQDAEDAFQATFLLLARKAQRIRRGAALAAWLHTTAVRVALRTRKRRLVRPAELPEVMIDDVPPEMREAGTVLDDAIRRLPARLRTAFVMCELECRTHAEAARELGCPKGTIDSRMAAARRQLRERLVRRGITLSPVIIVGAVGNEWALGELPRDTVSLMHTPMKALPPTLTELLARTTQVTYLKLPLAILFIAIVGTTALVGGLLPSTEPPSQANDKTKELAPGLAKASPVVVGTKSTWKRTTVSLPEGVDVQREMFEGGVKWLTHQYAAVTEDCRKSGRPLIPPSTPSIHGNHAIYRNDRGIGSIAIQSTKDPDGEREGEFYWNLDHDMSTTYAARELGPRSKFEDFLKDEQSSNITDQFLNNTLTSVFKAQDGYISSVDSLSILPSSQYKKRIPDGRQISFGVFNLSMRESMLKTWDIDSGKIRCKVTGRDRYDKEVDARSPIGPTLYLGSPLVIDGSAFAIHEQDRVLRLTSLKWDGLKSYWYGLKFDMKQPTTVDGKTFVQFDRDLVTAAEPLYLDTHRRIHAIYLTKANDLILCPTHLGRVVAVESKTGKIRWTHEYASLDAKRFPTFAPEWVVVPPVVVGDKYVYAPADFAELLCLNVADGKKVWSVKKGDGLYPAVVGDQVLVIGEKTLRSLNLKDGGEQWKLDLPGLPCGRGAMLGDTYLLPFSEPKTWKGMIAIVDPKAGKIIEVLKPEKDEPIGNLVVHQDFLISQTLTEIAAFPIKKKE